MIVNLDTGDSRIRPLLDQALVYVAFSRGASEMIAFTDDKQHLLSDHSPAQRIAIKPKALAKQEIEQFGMAVGL